MNALYFAEQMLLSGKYKETDGPNRSPALDALCKEFGYPLGVPWCALFVSKAFKQAYKANGNKGPKILYTAGSQALLAWFRDMQRKYPDQKWVSNRPSDLANWKGALIIRTDPGGKSGHVALVKGRLTTDGQIVAVETIEGNTNSAGSSNGDGAYKRKRSFPLTPYTWTFCNTSYVVGGQWWKNQ